MSNDEEGRRCRGRANLETDLVLVLRRDLEQTEALGLVLEPELANDLWHDIADGGPRVHQHSAVAAVGQRDAAHDARAVAERCT
jgi:hypothetical protein